MNIVSYISKTTFLSLIFLISCNTRTSKSVDTSVLSVNDTLHYKVTETLKVPLYFNLWDWKITSNHIVFFHQGKEQYVTLYNIADTSMTYTIANKGKGNNEYLSCCWCKTKKDNEITLYDIMKSALHIYDIGNKNAPIIKSYTLPTDDSGLTLPYTSMVHYKNTQYLMKEDGNETNLRLVDLNSGKEIASYHCVYRDNKQEPYTPYDYLFHVIDNKIILSYCYFDRIELLQIKDNTLELIAAYGEKDNFNVPKDYDLLQYSYLYTATKDDNFYLLKSREGQDEGDEILVLNADTHKSSIIKLPIPIKLLNFDTKGRLVGYNESDSGSVIYTFQEKK